VVNAHWKRRNPGGVQCSAADQRNVYVALSDLARTTIPKEVGADLKAGGGVALRLDNGSASGNTA
jgi:hypothetical protein